MELLCLLDFVLSEPEVNFQDSGQLDNQDYQTSTIQKIYNLAFIQEVMGCMLVFWMNFFFCMPPIYNPYSSQQDIVI